MARLKFFLHEPNSKKETPIFLSITYSGNRAKLKTKQRIKPRAWNPVSNSIRNNWTEYSEVQDELDTIESLVKREIPLLTKQFNGLPSSTELKRILEAKIFSDNIQDFRLSFLEYFKNFIKELSHKKNPKTSKPITRSTIETYEQTLEIIKEYEALTGDNISFKTLSNSTYNSLILHLEKHCKYAPNTVGKHIKNIKAIINSARDSGIALSKDYRSNYWKVIKQIKPAEEIIILSEKELDELWELDLSNDKMQEQSRDIFLVGAWTALRISDIIRLTKEHFDNDRGIITIRTIKTSTQLAIPTHPIVRKIINKYKGAMPKVAEPIVNKKIKDVCENIESLKKSIIIKEIKGNKIDIINCKRFDRVTTHTGRRSFASNMFRRNLPVHQIMAITGHKKEADFYRYIGVTNDEIAKGLSDKFKEWYK